ncbi:hypothetical protein BKA62DRAFT_825183 [Auriculariales sp. MPI-PUGE-AT-0066]|nr:hypothetical protein BKA62DRAFT_825183 [Auriculariales sp. MPI-PUGE-AT-0066]
MPANGGGYAPQRTDDFDELEESSLEQKPILPLEDVVVPRPRASRGRKRGAPEPEPEPEPSSLSDEPASPVAVPRSKGRARQRRKRAGSELLSPVDLDFELEVSPLLPSPPRSAQHNTRASSSSKHPPQPQRSYSNAKTKPTDKDLDEPTDLTPEEVAKKERVRVAARERQRKHRAVVKAKRMAELGLAMGHDGSAALPLYYDPHGMMHPPPHMSEELAHTDYPMVQPNTSPGQTFASIVMLAFQCAPMLKQHLLRQLAMTGEDLQSLEPSIAGCFDQWNQQRIQYGPRSSMDMDSAADSQQYPSRPSNGSTHSHDYSHDHQHHMHEHPSPYEHDTPPLPPDIEHDSDVFRRQSYAPSVRDTYPLSHMHGLPSIEPSYVRHTSELEHDESRSVDNLDPDLAPPTPHSR